MRTALLAEAEHPSDVPDSIPDVLHCACCHAPVRVVMSPERGKHLRWRCPCRDTPRCRICARRCLYHCNCRNGQSKGGIDNGTGLG